MSLVQNTNVAALLAQRRLEISGKNYQKSLERLSSGYRINRAADDAAGLTISQNLTSQVRRMQQAQRNTQDGVSVLQVAEGALTVMNDNLQRIRELTIQAANDTNGAAARDAAEDEIKSLLEDIDRIAAATQFNGISLLTGKFADPLDPDFDNALLQVGPNSDPVTNTVNISSALATANAFGLGAVGGAAYYATIAAIDIATNGDALNFLADIDASILKVNTMRARIGSYQNKLESVTANLDLAVENFSASNSRIRDIDVAAESSTMIQAQIIQQAATMVLGQTNQLPQMILSLLQN